MKVKLVCRRKYSCLIVISNWVADKVINHRQIWQKRICPTFKREIRETTWGTVQREKVIILLEEFYRDRLKARYKWKKNKPENEKEPEDHIARVSLRLSRAIQSEARREARLSQSAWRRVLTRTTVLTQPTRAWKELGGVSLFSSKSQSLKTF